MNTFFLLFFFQTLCYFRQIIFRAFFRFFFLIFTAMDMAFHELPARLCESYHWHEIRLCWSRCGAIAGRSPVLLSQIARNIRNTEIHCSLEGMGITTRQSNFLDTASSLSTYRAGPQLCGLEQASSSNQPSEEKAHVI